MVKGAIGLVIAACVVAILTACGPIPRDPEGTLDTVTDGTLRVAVSHNPPFTDLTDGGDPEGTEADLVREFAHTLDADIEWQFGGEEDLVSGMERGDYDLFIGGLTAQSPWQDMVAFTGPYDTTEDEHGTHDHVMAVRMGENGFLVALEDFLQHRDRG